jgi:hypothetical protein
MAEIIDFQANETPTFDPQKQYTWNTNDTFTLSGADFGLVLNALRSTISTQEAARILLAVDAHDAVQGALARAVEAGQVKEVEKEASNNSL